DAVRTQVRLPDRAQVACAARHDRHDDDAPAEQLAGDALARGIDGPDDLVAHHERRDAAGAGLTEPVQIRTADGGRADADAHLARARLGVWSVLQLHVPWAQIGECLHVPFRSFT